MSNGSNHDHSGERGAERVQLQHRNRCGWRDHHRRAVGLQRRQRQQQNQTCGVALHAASAGQPITYQNTGSLTIGGTVVAGTIYVAGATAGAINPASDLTTGWRTSIIGVATSASVIRLNIFNSDTAN
jgi:hypothetical protein